MKTKTEWGWMLPDDTNAYGPFLSREAAIKDAKEKYGAPIIIELGHCRYADSQFYVPDDLSSVLDQMDESAHDNEFASFHEREEIFVAKDGAGEALQKALRAWAREWVTSECWVLDKVEILEVTT